MSNNNNKEKKKNQQKNQQFSQGIFVRNEYLFETKDLYKAHILSFLENWMIYLNSMSEKDLLKYTEKQRSILERGYVFLSIKQIIYGALPASNPETIRRKIIELEEDGWITKKHFREINNSPFYRVEKLSEYGKRNMSPSKSSDTINRGPQRKQGGGSPLAVGTNIRDHKKKIEKPHPPLPVGDGFTKSSSFPPPIDRLSKYKKQTDLLVSKCVLSQQIVKELRESGVENEKVIRTLLKKAENEDSKKNILEKLKKLKNSPFIKSCINPPGMIVYKIRKELGEVERTTEKDPLCKRNTNSYSNEGMLSMKQIIQKSMGKAV